MSIIIAAKVFAWIWFLVNLFLVVHSVLFVSPKKLPGWDENKSYEEKAKLAQDYFNTVWYYQWCKQTSTYSGTICVVLMFLSAFF